MKNYIVIILSVLFIQHCEPYIVFDNSQPLNQKNQKEFDKKIQGTYFNEDSVELPSQLGQFIRSFLNY